MFRWTARLKGAPRAAQHLAVSVGHEVYSFHCSHHDHGGRMCVSIFNSVSLRWRKLHPATATTGSGSSEAPPPPRLSNHTAVLIEETIYVWGGCVSSVEFNEDLYAFHVHTGRWLRPRVSGSAPRGRDEHSACAVSGSKVMYVCGGYDESYAHVYDFHKLDTTAMVWSLVDAGATAAPPPRSLWHSATVVGTRMFVLEGQTMVSDEQLVRVFDLDTECWLSCNEWPFDDEEFHRGYYFSSFSYNGDVYVFCRKLRERGFGDLLKLDAQTFSWKKVQLRGEDPGWSRQPCCCVLGDRVILFGGSTMSMANVSDELFVLDLSPSLKTLCKMAVIQCGLESSDIPHDVRWELAAMTGTQQDHENSVVFGSKI